MEKRKWLFADMLRILLQLFSLQTMWYPFRMSPAVFQWKSYSIA